VNPLRKKDQKQADNGEASAQLAVVRSTLGIAVKAVVIFLFSFLLVQLFLNLLGVKAGLLREIYENVLTCIISLSALYRVTLRPLTRIAAQHAAVSAESRFRAVAQAVQDGIVIYDAKREILFVNKSAEQMYGYEEGGLHGKPLESLLPENLKPVFRENIEAYLRTKQSSVIGKGPVESAGLRTSGELFPVEICASELVVEGEIQFVVLVRDISERKRAESQLNERTARLNALIVNSPLSIVVLDEEQQVQMCNPAFEELFGYRAAEITGAEIDSVIASEEMRAEAQGMTRRVLSGEPSHAVTRRRRKDGSLVEVEVHGVPLVMDGKAVGAYAIYQDLTERRKQKAETKKLELRYRDLFEQANDAIVIFRPGDEVILDANPRAHEMYGFPRGEFIGMSLKKITQDVARGEERISRLLKERRAWNFETVHFRKNGETMHLLCSGSLIEYEGEPAIMGVLHDFTEQKKAAEALRTSEETQRKLADQLRATLDALPVGVRIVHQRRIIFANQADARMHGFASAADLVGQNSLLQIVPEDRDRAIANVKQLEEGESNTVCYQLRRIRKDHSVFPAAVSVVALNFDGLPALLVAMEDLTERQRLELYEQILPVCCVCGKIRNDEGAEKGKGEWERLDHFVSRHFDAQVSHTFCPICLEEYRRREGIK